MASIGNFSRNTHFVSYVVTVGHNVETQGNTPEMLDFGQFHICMQCIVNVFPPSLSYFCVSCSIKRSLFTVK